MADQTGLRSKLLRGWRPLTLLIYGDNSPRSRRKLYTEWKRYPIFQLGKDTELLALEDRLLSFLEARSAAAEVAAELAAVEPKAALSSPSMPKVRRRRRTAAA